MRITAAPTLQTTTGTVSGHLKGQVDFRVRMPDNSLAEAFTVDMVNILNNMNKQMCGNGFCLFCYKACLWCHGQYYIVIIT